MAESVLKIRIIAQPQASYRERYISELDPRRHRAQRFIRADPNPDKFDYPTIEIPRQHSHNKRLYIRITPITIMTEQVPVTCVHPYPIDTSDSDVIKDLKGNTLFFHITEEDFRKGFKSFRITRKKLIQYELRNYGQLFLLNQDERDIQRLTDPTDARKLIDTYQLGKSRLVFSFAELVHDNNPLPVIYAATSEYSNIMTAITSTTTTSNEEEPSIRYAPKESSWQGGEEILIVIPKIDRRKTCKVIFDHPSMLNIDDIQINFVDTKTILFLTPPCPLLTTGNQRLHVPLIVMQGAEEIARIDFVYQSFEKCSVCQTNLMVDSFDENDVSVCDNDEDIKRENDFLEN